MSTHLDSNTNPSVSVIMPVYNASKYLDEAITSIRNQSFEDFELIVVDDGSTDGSTSIAELHAEEDRRVRLISSAHHGVAKARNIGLAEARAQWVAKMDADDIAHPMRLERQLSFLRARPEVVLTGSYAWMVGPTGKIVGQSILGPTTVDEYAAQKAEIRVNFLNPTVMFNRQIIVDEGGYSEDYPSGEDYELFNRIASNHLVLTQPEHLLYYRIHDAATGTRRMREQTESWARVRINIQRQRGDMQPLSIEEFRALRRQAKPLKRLKRELRLRSRQAYRKAGARLAASQPSGIAWLVLSVILFPSTPIARFKSQVLDPVSVKVKATLASHFSGYGQNRRVVTVWRAIRMPTAFRNFWSAYLNRLNLAASSEDVVYAMRPKGSFVMSTGPADVKVLNDVWLDRMYEWEPDFVVQPDWNVLDVGAHRGAFTVRAALSATGVKVIAVEPDPSNLRLLSKTLQLNSLTNVEVVQGAAWTSDDTETMLLSGERKSTNNRLLATASLSETLDKPHLAVRTYALESLLDRFNSPVNLLKMDIEGAELQVLHACPIERLSAIERIVLEYHRYGAATAREVSEQVTRILKDAGFSVTRTHDQPIIYAKNMHKEVGNTSGSQAR